MTNVTITALRTIRITERPNLFWLEIETSDGLTGLGEAFRGTQAVEAVLHDQIAPFLLGQDARRIEAISRNLLTPYIGFGSSSAEIRAASAVDLALWDLAGQRHGIPIHEALGGASRTEIRAYNTCAGYDYNSRGVGRREIASDDTTAGPYDDQVAFMRDAGTLAESLLSEGYTAMKIWPFDPLAAKTGGQAITLEDLRKGIEPFAKIRDTVGHRIEIMAELHSVWSAPAATRICQALEEFDVFWAEDPIAKMNDVAALADLRRRTRTPICASETLGGKVAFRDLLRRRRGRYRHARSKLVRRPHRGPQDRRPRGILRQAHCTPRLHRPGRADGRPASRSARSDRNLPGSRPRHPRHLYRELVTDLPVITAGLVQAPTAGGLGTRLKPEVKTRPDAVVREAR